MGRGDADHTPVIEFYMKEVSELMKGFDCYFVSSNTIEHVALGLYCWSADRPENHELTNTRKEGAYGKINGWAVNVSEECLPAFIPCYASLIRKIVHEEEITSPFCSECANWSLAREDNGLEVVQCMNDVAPKDYPKQYPGGSDVKAQPSGRTCSDMILPPKKLDTKWMLQAV